MIPEYSISIYLDKRRAKSNGKYPVRLRVFTPHPRKQKLYPTTFDFTEKEFASIWETSKPRKEYKQIRFDMLAVEKKASEVAKEIIPFSFAKFEKKLFRKKGDGVRLSYHYNERINDYKKQNRISTADSYRCSQNSLKSFVENQHKNYSNLTLLDIDTTWLQSFEKYMIDRGRSVSTVGIYLRPLRAIFNKAIQEGEIEKEVYPFGKRNYQIPTAKNVKKALTKQQMKLLFQAKPSNKEQQKAKDFWFLSYNCNGMNIKDIAQLKYEDLRDGKIIFYRTKTLFTSKTELKPVVVYLNPFIEAIIEAYSTQEKTDSNYIFDIIHGNDSAEKRQTKIKNFTRFINQHLKKLCKANELPTNISTYWARHSFATLSVQKGASLEFMQESLGHKNITTTQTYFAGFDDDTKKDFAKGLMDFD